MKPVITTFWVFIGLFIGLAAGGYIPATDKYGQPDKTQQLFQLLGGAAAGIYVGLGVGKAITDPETPA